MRKGKRSDIPRNVNQPIVFADLSDLQGGRKSQGRDRTLFDFAPRRYRKKVNIKTIAKIVLGWLCLAMFFYCIPRLEARLIIVGLGVLHTILQLI